MQRLSTQPPEALLFSTQAPIDAARTARLLALITPALDARARALQSDLNELTEMRQEMAQRRDQLAAAVDKLAGENGKLAKLINKKADVQRSTLAESAAAQSKLDKLAGQAKNLQDLVDRLNKAKVETGPAAPASVISPISPKWDRRTRCLPRRAAISSRISAIQRKPAVPPRGWCLKPVPAPRSWRRLTAESPLRDLSALTGKY
jgi:ABC-type transporter Mla subunit MlaD